MPYVYRHIRLDKNEPFYIGISLGNDPSYKRAYFKRKRNIIWNRIVNKSDYRVEIIFEDDCQEVIKEKEKEFIALYGRIDKGLGTLCNMTDGGDGTIGREVEDHVREAVRNASRNRPTSQKQKQVVGDRYRGKSGILHNRSKPVYCKEDDLYFGSTSELSKNLGINPGTVRYYINNNKKYKNKSYVYCKKEEIILERLHFEVKI